MSACEPPSDERRQWHDIEGALMFPSSPGHPGRLTPEGVEAVARHLDERFGTPEASPMSRHEPEGAQ